MKGINGTMAYIRRVDKDLLERIAKAKDWSQTTALAKAIRKLAEAEQIDVADGDAPASVRKNPDLFKDREPVGV
jgi:hypothetical protein